MSDEKGLTLFFPFELLVELRGPTDAVIMSYLYHRYKTEQPAPTTGFVKKILPGTHTTRINTGISSLIEKGYVESKDVNGKWFVHRLTEKGIAVMSAAEANLIKQSNPVPRATESELATERCLMIYDKHWMDSGIAFDELARAFRLTSAEVTIPSFCRWLTRVDAAKDALDRARSQWHEEKQALDGLDALVTPSYIKNEREFSENENT